MKEFNIMIKGASIHPKKGYVNKKLKEEGKVEENIKLAFDNNILKAFLEEEDEDNLFGMAKKIVDNKGKIYPANVLLDLINADNYTAKIVGFDNDDRNVFIVNLKEVEVEKYEDNDEEETTVDEQIERIINEGICEKTELLERIKVMKSNRVSEEIIRDVLKQYKKYEKEIKKPKTVYVDPFPKSKESSVVQNALLNALFNFPTIFEGIQSTGKNVCAETVAWLLGKPYYLISIDARTEKDDIFGAKKTMIPEFYGIEEDKLLKWAKSVQKVESGNATDEEFEEAAKYLMLRDKAASVNIITENSEFCDWLKNGGVLMINEINMAEANFLQSFINPIGDSTGFLNTGDGRIYVNPDCWLLGCQNEGFVGSMQQNSATKSRFGVIQFPASNSIRKQIVAECGPTPEDMLKQCETLYKLFINCSSVEQVVSSDCLNIRGFCRAVKAAKKYRSCTTLQSQILIHVVNSCSEDEREQLAAQVRDIITI